MFKPANTDSAIPAVLQPYTKENLVFQLALATVFVGGMIAKDYLEERKQMKRLEQASTAA